MKYWRKHGRKVEQEDGTIVRTGRSIKYQNQMLESLSKSYKKSNPLLDALFTKMGMRYVLTAKQQQALADLKAREGKESFAFEAESASEMSEVSKAV